MILLSYKHRCPHCASAARLRALLLYLALTYVCQHPSFISLRTVLQGEEGLTYKWSTLNTRLRINRGSGVPGSN